jgi:hypothetical protein
MQNPQSQQIHGRFFQAIDALVLRRQLRGKKSFATKYELNQGNFFKLRNNPQAEFPLHYLTLMVEDFNVSAHYLLTGKGEIFNK